MWLNMNNSVLCVHFRKWPGPLFAMGGCGNSRIPFTQPESIILSFSWVMFTQIFSGFYSAFNTICTIEFLQLNMSRCVKSIRVVLMHLSRFMRGRTRSEKTSTNNPGLAPYSSYIYQ